MENNNLKKANMQFYNGDILAKHKTKKAYWKYWGLLLVCLIFFIAATLIFPKILNMTKLTYSKEVNVQKLQEFPANAVNPKAQIDLVSRDFQSVFNDDTDIFRGIVQKLDYYKETGKFDEVYFTVIEIKVTDVYRGEMKKGDTYSIYLPYTPNAWYAASPGISDEQLKTGSEGIFMPFISTKETGTRYAGHGFLCYADFAKGWFRDTDANRYIFLDTEELSDTNIYDIPSKGKKLTLDDVSVYIKKQFLN